MATLNLREDLSLTINGVHPFDDLDVAPLVFLQFLPTTLQNGTGHLLEFHVVHEASLAQNNAATSIRDCGRRHDSEEAFEKKLAVRKSEISSNLNDDVGVITIR